MKANIKDVCVLADSKPSNFNLYERYLRCEQSPKINKDCHGKQNFWRRFARYRERSGHYKLSTVMPKHNREMAMAVRIS